MSQSSTESPVDPSEIRYAMYAVFRAAERLTDADRPAIADEVSELLDQAATKGVVTRGAYSLTGYRADADFMFWWISSNVDDIQETYIRFLRSRLGRLSVPAWSAIGVHRPAEFNQSHIPSFMTGTEPGGYIAVYPYNRTNDWYVLEPAERAAMLREHGEMGREYTDVLPNTISSFALGDYEFLLAFEADELHRIVDLMRYLRGARARLHTRLETPFFTGPRKPISELVAALP